MVLELPTASRFSDQIVKDIVRAALRNQAEIARFRHELFLKECHSFEQKFGFSTDDFLVKVEMGELDDSEEFLDWFAAARGYQVWQQKFQVLDGILLE